MKHLLLCAVFIATPLMAEDLVENCPKDWRDMSSTEIYRLAREGVKK